MCTYLGEATWRAFHFVVAGELLTWGLSLCANLLEGKRCEEGDQREHTAPAADSSAVEVATRN